MTMAGLGVIWVTAPSLNKLAAELDRRLAGYSADAVVSVSHSAAITASRTTGGIWGGARTRREVEYSAVALVRSDQGLPRR